MSMGHRADPGDPRHLRRRRRTEILTLLTHRRRGRLREALAVFQDTRREGVVAGVDARAAGKTSIKALPSREFRRKPVGMGEDSSKSLPFS
jgi:hypothetical protein